MPDTLDLPRQSVLVLGASGFIGSRMVAALEASPRYRPIAASRRSTLSVDATNLPAMQRALQDVAYVVNCIAGNGKTMTTATQVLCDAARARPPVRIVHLSSMAVYGAATGTVREDHAAVAPISAYGSAKIACENIIRKYVADGGDAVILRPTCVFGPDGPQWTTRIAALLAAGRLGDLGPAGDGHCNLAFIDDLTAGITRALSASGVSGQAYNVSGRCELTWNEFLVRFGMALNTAPIRRLSLRRLRRETRLMAPARKIANLGLKRMGMQVGEAITPSMLALFQQDIRIDPAAAIATLSLPQTPVDRMIAIAAASLARAAATGGVATDMEPARS